MSEECLRVIGSFLSPYVRKVIVCLECKGLRYEVDPISPFYGNEEFARISPLRRVPVLLDGHVVIADSTAICEYLEERHPARPLLPQEPAMRARARWLEEYSDTRIGDVIVWRYFYQVVTRKIVWREEPDAAIVAAALNEDIPSVLDYLETQAPAEGPVCGTFSIADIAIASFFRNAQLLGYDIDADRWPKTSALVRSTLKLKEFQKLRMYEDALMTSSPNERRNRLIELGAPITARSLGRAEPTRGIIER